MAVDIRSASPDDYGAITAVLDDWWGRPISGSLPRLFLDHFHATSFVAEEDGELAGFLIGFHSPSLRGVSYVHFVGVHPRFRRAGLARDLYDRFIGLARDAGSSEVRAITAPSNAGSIRFHSQLGFTVSGPIPDYNGPAKPMITFALRIG